MEKKLYSRKKGKKNTYLLSHKKIFSDIIVRNVCLFKIKLLRLYKVNLFSVCRDQYYGSDCNTPCGHCKDDDVCNNATGSCPGGCQTQWIGNSCDGRFNDGNVNLSPSPKTPLRYCTYKLSQLVYVTAVQLYLSSSLVKVIRVHKIAHVSKYRHENITLLAVCTNH